MLAISRALIGAIQKSLCWMNLRQDLASGVLDALFEVIKKTRREGVSLLLVEQNLELASRIAKHCLVLSVVGSLGPDQSTGNSLMKKHSQSLTA